MLIVCIQIVWLFQVLFFCFHHDVRIVLIYNSSMKLFGHTKFTYWHIYNIESHLILKSVSTRVSVLVCSNNINNSNIFFKFCHIVSRISKLIGSIFCIIRREETYLIMTTMNDVKQYLYEHWDIQNVKLEYDHTWITMNKYLEFKIWWFQ